MVKKILKLVKALGPGLITGAADDDPTAIATYSQSGAEFGYQQLWTAVYITPFMIYVQEMSGRIGLVTGKGIAEILRERFSKPVLYVSVSLLFLANVINIGADLGAMAASLQLLLKLPFLFFLCIVTLCILVLQITVPYVQYARILKIVSLFLVSYIFSALLIKNQWGQILKETAIPYLSLKKDYLINLVAILGTNISPYLFFWQANQEVEEEVEKKKLPQMDQGKPVVYPRDIQALRVDTITGMIFSNIIVFFIEVTAAGTLGVHGIHQVDTPAQAASALRPIAGNYAFILFVLGIIASGMLSIPILAGSVGYAVAESLKKKAGLYRKVNQAPFFYSVITLVTVLGIVINFLQIKPFDLLIYAAALNGILTPVLLILILCIANNKKIMGKYCNTRLKNIMCLFITCLMTVSACLLILNLIHPL